MPRYFISTSDKLRTYADEEGVVLPDTQALAKMLGRTLAAILQDECGVGSFSELEAEALDESGHRVMSAKISLSIAGS